jgi:hypothetical protein
MIRARIREDLDLLRKTYMYKLGPTITSKGTDYPYRAIIRKAEFAKGMARIARDIDYGNFKSKVEQTQGLPREQLYARVWAVMAGAERDLQQKRVDKWWELDTPSPVRKRKSIRGSQQSLFPALPLPLPPKEEVPIFYGAAEWAGEEDEDKIPPLELREMSELDESPLPELDELSELDESPLPELDELPPEEPESLPDDEDLLANPHFRGTLLF